MYRIFISFIILIMFLGPTFAQSNNGIKKKQSHNPIGIELSDKPAVILDGKRIDLDDAIRLAIEQNQDIISGKYDVAMADSRFESFKKKYSPFLSASGGLGYQKFTESMEAFTGEDAKILNSTFAISKMFSTGTTLSAGIQHEYTKSSMEEVQLPVYAQDGSYLGSSAPMLFGDPEYHRPVLFAGIQQELLKNAFGYSERREHQILKNEGLIERETLISYLSILVVKVIADYWDLVYKKKTLNNANLQLQETKAVRKIIAENVRIGLAERFELNYYNMLVAAAESTKATAKQDYQDSKRNFLQVVNLGEDLKIEDSAILSNVLPKINKEKAVLTAYENRADYKAALLGLKNAEMRLEIYENDSLPSLTAGFNMTTLGQKKSMNDAFADSSSGKYPSLEAQIKITYPLDNREQKINERNASYKLEQAKVQLEKTKRQVRDDVVSKIEHIKTFYDVYNKTSIARTESEAYYKRMLKSLRRGRFNAASVKNALDAQVQTRQGEFGALIRYNIALLEFDVSKNELFDKYNIDIDKYIPKQ